jgi:hypothetical protein
MNDRRVDRVGQILEKYGRLRVAEVVTRLREVEENPGLARAAIYLAVDAENERLKRLGQLRRFRTWGDGTEDRGWLSLESRSEFDPGTTASEIEARILKANSQVDEQIRERLERMHWRTFEDTFLTQVLERLGFQNVQITQATRDGGVDARITYKRGLVEARAIVSAKRWTTKNSVGTEEVHRMRGIKGEEDTAIIITTSKFSADAKREAKPGQNQRAVYLIDGDELVSICKQFSIGVKPASLPQLLVLDLDEMPIDEAEDAEDAEGTEGDDNGGSRSGTGRLRREMLGDGERGVSVDEIASLLGLKASTVGVYLSQRKDELFDRMRRDPEVRERALRIVSRRRGA